VKALETSRRFLASPWAQQLTLQTNKINIAASIIALHELTTYKFHVCLSQALQEAISSMFLSATAVDRLLPAASNADAAFSLLKNTYHQGSFPFLFTRVSQAECSNATTNIVCNLPGTHPNRAVPCC
jgi:hypothetical protein